MGHSRTSMLLKVTSILWLAGSILGMFSQRNIYDEIIWSVAITYLLSGLFQALLIFAFATIIDLLIGIYANSYEMNMKTKKIQGSPSAHNNFRIQNQTRCPDCKAIIQPGLERCPQCKALLR